MRKPLLKTGIELHIKNAKDRIVHSEKIAELIYDKINSKFPTNHSYRPLVQALTDFYFYRSIQLISLGQLPSAYIDMHALLEEAAIGYFPKSIKLKDNIYVLRDLIKRKTLIDLAGYYKDLGLWDKKDITFIKKLSNIRNGVVHRNIKLLIKHLGSKKGFMRGYDSVNFKTEDCVNSLATCIELCIKVAKTQSRKNI